MRLRQHGTHDGSRLAERRAAHHSGLQPQVQAASQHEQPSAASRERPSAAEAAGQALLLPPEHRTAHERPDRNREQHVLRGRDDDLHDDERIHCYFTVKV